MQALLNKYKVKESPKHDFVSCVQPAIISSTGVDFKGILLVQAPESMQRITRLGATRIWPDYRYILELIINFNSYSEHTATTSNWLTE